MPVRSLALARKNSTSDSARSDAGEILTTLGLGRRQRWKRALRWLLAVSIIGAAIAALVLWLTWDREPDIQWQTVTAERGDIAMTIDATGTLEPETSVIIGAEVSGKLATVEVEEDDVVALGQVLARFDLESFESELAEAEASLASSKADVTRARASLRAAELELARTRKLGKAGVSSEEELERRQSEVELAKAELTRAHAQQELANARVAQVRTKIAKAEVHAPIAGVVLRRAVEPGSTVAATFQSPELFTIAADLARMKLELAIDEADVGRIAVGQTASFHVDAWPEREFVAKVAKVHLSPQVSGNVVTYLAELGVDNREGLLRPGMTATATVAIGVERDVLRIPTEALRFTPPSSKSTGFRFGPPPAERKHALGSAVWVLRGGEPVRVAITAGASDGRWIAITGGELEVGDEVLVGAETDAER